MRDNPAPAEAEDADSDIPLNRAERRAKRKRGAQPQTVQKINPTVHLNAGLGKRQYSSRRSGG